MHGSTLRATLLCHLCVVQYSYLVLLLSLQKKRRSPIVSSQLCWIEWLMQQSNISCLRRTLFLIHIATMIPTFFFLSSPPTTDPPQHTNTPLACYMPPCNAAHYRPPRSLVLSSDAKADDPSPRFLNDSVFHLVLGLDPSMLVSNERPTSDRTTSGPVATVKEHAAWAGPGVCGLKKDRHKRKNSTNESHQYGFLVHRGYQILQEAVDVVPNPRYKVAIY